MRFDLRLHELQLGLEDIFLELLALGLSAMQPRLGARRASRAGSRRRPTTQPMPMPRLMVSEAPQRRS
jgi:hypothetical protein